MFTHAAVPQRPYNELAGARPYERPPGLVVLSWHTNTPAKPRKWTSSELVQRGLVFCCSTLKDNMTSSDPHLPNYLQLQHSDMFKVWEAANDSLARRCFTGKTL